MIKNILKASLYTLLVALGFVCFGAVMALFTTYLPTATAIITSIVCAIIICLIWVGFYSHLVNKKNIEDEEETEEKMVELRIVPEKEK